MGADAARPFTGVTLDRASEERKDPEMVRRLLSNPAARSLVAGENGVLIGSGSPEALLRTPAVPDAEPILLGCSDGEPLFAVDLEALPAERMDGGRVISLRDAGAELPHAEAGLAAYATALLNWHRRHRFCANCGTRTDMREAGYSRHCPNCGRNHFPRTDPVVIMTIEHDGHVLLGRREGWPAPRMSVLAGFVSPGESAEEAVVREVEEESGIIARDPVFVASQPWPFPASLMLGFEAVSDGGSPRAADGELAEAAWFSRSEVRAAARDENPHLILPPPISIARFLLERWAARAG